MRIRPAGSSRRRWHLADLTARWPYALLAIVLAASMWPAWTTRDAVVIGGDAVLIHYPYFVLWRDQLAAGELPFWNPYTFSGIPAFATLQAGYGYPPHWLLTPLPPMVAMNWLIGLHVLLAGLGTAWCAGRLGATREGQVLAGLAYGLGSASVARLWAGHFSFLEANAWLPLATGLAAGVGRRHAVSWLALAVGMLALAGQPELLIFSAWWLPAWALIGSLGAVGEGATGEGATGGRPIRALLRGGLGLGLGLGLAAFQLLPVAEMLGISNRQVGMSWDFRTGASLPPWHLLELFGPLAYGDPRSGYWPGPGYEWHERLLFVGVVPLLAAAGLKGRWRWACWGGALVAVALAFGRYAPWYSWTDLVPGYASLRIPSKHLVLAALALSLAAGLGLPRLGGGRAAFGTLGLAGLLGLLGVTSQSWLPLTGPVLGGADLLTAASGASTATTMLAGLAPGIATLVCAAVIILIRNARVRRALLVTLAAVELIVVLQPFRVQPSSVAPFVADGAILRDHPRAAVVSGDGGLLANFGPVLHVQQPAGYVSIFSGGYMALLTGGTNPGVVLEASREADSILMLLGYDVLVDRKASLVTIVVPPPPRAWVARCVWPGGAQEARAPDFPRTQCVTQAGAVSRQQAQPAGPARIVAEGAGWLTVETIGPGWLVTTQPWYPGWQASNDSGWLPVEQLDGALVGVRLPDGQQTVQIRYVPGGLLPGLVITAVVLLSVAFAWWIERADRADWWRRALTAGALRSRLPDV